MFSLCYSDLSKIWILRFCSLIKGRGDNINPTTRFAPLTLLEVPIKRKTENQDFLLGTLIFILLYLLPSLLTLQIFFFDQMYNYLKLL